MNIPKKQTNTRMRISEQLKHPQDQVTGSMPNQTLSLPFFFSGIQVGIGVGFFVSAFRLKIVDWIILDRLWTSPNGSGTNATSIITPWRLSLHMICLVSIP